MENLANTYRKKHLFPVACSPWWNGSVESLIRSVLYANRTIIAELELSPQDWLSVIMSISYALNESILDRLGHFCDGIARSPLEVMTWVKSNRPVLKVTSVNYESIQAHLISHAREVQFISIDTLRRDLENLHKSVAVPLSRRLEHAIPAQNKATNIISPSFVFGDFAKVRRANDHTHKLRCKWFSPFRMTAVYSPLLYYIIPIQGRKCDQVHCTLFFKYRDSLLAKYVRKEVPDLIHRTVSSY